MEYVIYVFWFFVICGLICLVIGIVACKNAQPYRETEEHRRKQAIIDELTTIHPIMRGDLSNKHKK